MLSELNNESFRLKRFTTITICKYYDVQYTCIHEGFLYIVHACTYVLTIHVFHSVKKSNADKQVLVTTY